MGVAYCSSLYTIKGPAVMVDFCLGHRVTSSFWDSPTSCEALVIALSMVLIGETILD